MSRHPKHISPERRAQVDAWTRPPVDVQTEWDAITAAHEQPVTDGMRFIASVFEDAGLRVSIHDGAVWADLVDTDPDTGVRDGITFRTTQEA